jgi:hypothetical protein
MTTRKIKRGLHTITLDEAELKKAIQHYMGYRGYSCRPDTIQLVPRLIEAVVQAVPLEGRQIQGSETA